MRHPYPVLATTLVWIAVTASANSSEEPPALPNHLVLALTHRSAPVMARFNWNAAASLPSVRLLLETETKDLPRELMGAEPAIRLVHLLGLDDSEFEELWIESPAFGSSTFTRSWVKTIGSVEKLRADLVDAGWKQVTDEPNTFWNPRDLVGWEREIEEADTIEDEAERDLAWKNLRRVTHRVVILDDGWLHAVPPNMCLSTFLPKSTDDPPGRLPIPELDFPFDGLLVPGDPPLCTIAIDIPDNDSLSNSEPQDNQGPVTIDQLERERRRLKDLPANVIISGVGDFLITATEIDGGLAIDLTARRPDGRGSKESTVFIQTVTLVLRLAVSYASVNLSRDLADLRIHEHEEQVNAGVVLSWSGIEEAMETEIERQQEIRKIDRRVSELRAATAADR